MIEKIFAAAMLAVCLVLLVRLLAGARARRRIDHAARRAWAAGRGWRDRVARPSAERRARRAADAAIRRAKSGSWDGNVFRPSSFKGKDRPAADEPPKKKDLH